MVVILPLVESMVLVMVVVGARVVTGPLLYSALQRAPRQQQNSMLPTERNNCVVFYLCFFIKLKIEHFLYTFNRIHLYPFVLKHLLNSAYQSEYMKGTGCDW
jgi:hypothetical protein